MVKDLLGIIAVILIFIAYISYIRDTHSGKTKPHVFTWLLSCIFGAIIFYFQISHNGGNGAWVTAFATVICFYIFILSVKYGSKNITGIDTLLFCLSIFIGIIWFFTTNAVLTTVLFTLASVISFMPTLTKSWNKPFEETLSSYSINFLRYAITIYILGAYSIVTLVHPVSWFFVNGIFCLFLIYRRRHIQNKNLKS